MPFLLPTVLLLSAPAQDPLPRFGLAVGQELRYEVRAGSWFGADGPGGKPKIPREADGTPKYAKRHELTVYVTARNADGSFRVVLHTTSAAGYPVVSYADLFADGRITWHPAAMPLLEFDSLRGVFPLLPQDDRRRREGWQEADERTGIRTRYTLADGWIRAESEGPLDRVSDGAFTLRYRLRPQDLMPEEVRVAGFWKSYKEAMERAVTLQEVRRHDAAWADRFAADAATYFTAAQRYREVVGQNIMARALAARKGEAGKLLDDARAGLAAARAEVRERVFRADLERKLKDCDEFRKSRLESAARYARIAGEPSPAWRAADLGGKEVSADGLRGRVVVMDFWFRQCSFCMRAMPQVEATADHFRRAGTPVSFLAVSIDKKDEDARYVADRLKPSYPVIRSEEVAMQYGVESYPTLLVLDPQGCVQGIFLGFSPTLREDLTRCVQDVLDKRKAN